ncbi:cation:proton antiporter [Arenibaculum pallidiluteum]|uniref:cation:proton antiporter n=1 Tax=Arenibaculum pallidiluteum TaxID=2812559 RepID=UPI001A96D87D|nr:cation:proton antiporter [Arenibaculum pallidiluteum]
MVQRPADQPRPLLRNSMNLPSILLALAVLLCLVGLIQPVALRLRLPHSILLAFVGVCVALVLGFLLHSNLTDAFNDIAELVLGLPINSGVFIYVFLPPLLFQAAMGLDVRRMAEDAAPILLLAVVAVVITTAFVGFALAPLTGLPLVACLLLGSIVATTDPSAVVAIFRDLGAPERLTRLVEGESLLNDAAAIAIFGILLGLLVSGRPPDLAAGIASFLHAFVGGMATGIIAGRLVLAAMPLMRDLRTAQITLTVALPYVVFIFGEQYLEVSGVVAAVAAGLVMAALGRTRISPDNWRFLEEMWEQIAFWAGSLVFLLAAILVPRILMDVERSDVLPLLALVAATLAARATVLFGLLPMLSWVRLAEPVNAAYKLVILWGGLRGALTLALALAVTENRGIEAGIKQFVAVVATGYVLSTLFVNGLTLRPLIRLLGLDRLSPVDAALRQQVLALSLGNVRDALREAAREHEIGPKVLRDATGPYEARMAEASRRADMDDAITDRDRVAIGLVALANRERELVLDHRRQGTVSPHIAERLLLMVGRIVEAARSGGRLGYLRAARRMVAFGPDFRAAHLLHRRFRIDRPLIGRLADRFETLMVSRMVLRQLGTFTDRKLAPLLGRRVADLLAEVVRGRIDATGKALDALRLQYPEYADALEHRILNQTGMRLERYEYDTLRDEHLIGPELHGDLLRELQAAEDREAARPSLDLGLDTPDLVRRFEMFDGLDDADLDNVGRLFVARFAVPGETIIRKGDRGDSAYFISSGAVEVLLPGRAVRLGRGDFFGEMALMSGKPRSADVRALGYCRLLVLRAADLRRFLRVNPALRARFEAAVRARNTADHAAGEAALASRRPPTPGAKAAG